VRERRSFENKPVLIIVDAEDQHLMIDKVKTAANTIAAISSKMAKAILHKNGYFCHALQQNSAQKK
jgi:hypothetical protein